MAERAQYVTLGVAEELFAAPVDKVQEILDMRPIARLGGPFYAGLGEIYNRPMLQKPPGGEGWGPPATPGAR